MSYFKKFSDFCSGFCAFMALIYLFRQFMSFDPKDDELGMLDKVKMFFSKTAEYDNLLLLWLIFFCVTAVLIGRIAARLPYVSLLATVPPMLLTVDMVKSSYIKEYPLLYVLLGAIAVIGAVFECVRMDKADGKRRSAWAGNLVSLFSAAFFLWIYKKTEAVTAVGNASELNNFDYEIYRHAPDMDVKLLMTFAMIFAATVLVSLLLSDVYFIHGIISIPPAVALIYLWSANKLTVHPELLVTLSLINLTTRTIPALSAKVGDRRGGRVRGEPS